MASSRRILIADPDAEAIRWLSRSLRQRGHQVFYAQDGSRALELAVLRQPDLILFDEACTLVDARTFLQILRANPRTETIPVVLMTSQEDSANVRAFRDGFLRKPFHPDEVQSRIEQLLRKIAASRALGSEASEIEGQLSQMGLPDLLQILAINKRSGRLTVTSGGEKGELEVLDGRPVQARLHPLSGEKALYRLLVWTEGTFAFVPGAFEGEKAFDTSMEAALLEGHRQADEMARLWHGLPARGTRLALTSQAHKAPDQHPVTQLVLSNLEKPKTLGELLDGVALPDIDVLGAVSALFHHGLLHVIESTQPRMGPLLEVGLLHAVKAKVLKRRDAQKRGVYKAFVVAHDASSVQAWRAGMSYDGWVPSTTATGDVGFGTLGRLDVGEGFSVDWVWLPSSSAVHPLWQALGHGGLGALILDEHKDSLALARFLVLERRLPALIQARKTPDSLVDAGKLLRASTEDAVSMVKTLFLHLMQVEEAAPRSELASAG